MCKGSLCWVIVDSWAMQAQTCRSPLTFSQGLLKEVVLGLKLRYQVPALQILLHFLEEWKKTMWPVDSWFLRLHLQVMNSECSDKELNCTAVQRMHQPPPRWVQTHCSAHAYLCAIPIVSLWNQWNVWHRSDIWGAVKHLLLRRGNGNASPPAEWAICFSQLKGCYCAYSPI